MHHASTPSAATDRARRAQDSAQISQASPETQKDRPLLCSFSLFALLAPAMLRCVLCGSEGPPTATTDPKQTHISRIKPACVMRPSSGAGDHRPISSLHLEEQAIAARARGCVVVCLCSWVATSSWRVSVPQSDGAPSALAAL